jgi:hypothetical protein
VIINKSKARPQSARGLGRSGSPCGHPPLQKPARLPTATLWASEGSPPPLGCRGGAAAALWCRVTVGRLAARLPPGESHHARLGRRRPERLVLL